MSNDFLENDTKKLDKMLFVVGRLGGGGAERVLMVIADAFHEQGYDVTIVSFSDYDKEYTTECKVVSLNSFGSIKNIWQQIRCLRKALKKISPTVVISFEYPLNMRTILASVGLNVKTIISERNDPNALKSKMILEKARNFLYEFCDVLVCQTQDAKKYFSTSIQSKSVVIPNPVKNNLPFWKIENSKSTIINFCRLEKQKNILLLIEAFEMLHKDYPDYKLLIYGDGAEKSNILHMIDDKKLTDYVIVQDFDLNIHDIAIRSKLFVSSSDYEGLSNSMLEALAMGMPVISTDCPIGGARMMIKNEFNGILVECNNSIDLYTAMKKVISNSNLMITISTNALETRKVLSIETIFEKWQNLI